MSRSSDATRDPMPRPAARVAVAGSLGRDPSSQPSLGSIARDEGQRTQTRMRHILILGPALAPIVLLFDWLVGTRVEAARTVPIVLLHLGALGVMAAMALHLRLRSSSRAALLYRRIATPLLVIVGAAIPALLAGGLASFYGLLVAVLVAGRAASRNDHWREALPGLAVTAAIYPTILLGAAVISPRIAAQLADPRQVGVFVCFTIITCFVTAIGAAGSHAAFLLRSQLYAAREVGKYQLDRRIGQGGMGEVWAAYYPPLRRHVALKLLRQDERDPAVQLTRFEREVAATAELTHPHTVRIFDFGVTDDGLWYYAMELLEGDTLKALVRKDGPLAPARAALLIRDAASAIAEAHARGIVHRDLKPENLFVTRVGDADFLKVLDFGLARRPLGDSVDLTRRGAIGTPAYFAPEVARGARAAEPADVYALGASLYFALAGVPPFAQEDLHAVLAAILTEPPPSVAQARGERLPRALVDLVHRAIASDPAARPSAAELARELEALGWSLRDAARS